jgi:hypothetical protein
MEQKNETTIDKIKKKSSVAIVNFSLKTEPGSLPLFSGFPLRSVKQYENMHLSVHSKWESEKFIKNLYKPIQTAA